jgi:hypothetical protein
MDALRLMELVASIGGFGGFMAVLVLFYARRDLNTHAIALGKLAENQLSVIVNNTEATAAHTAVLSGMAETLRELRTEVSALRVTRQGS